eukprot:TRINITY_DN57433_c0_g1_i1.p1 TRINITY_DN57433_c0_g1~~TRINITY_DN57433_c0_g1_i1.p1  ORF type:complete len:550 (+),score=47.83 TRINITY_DN57433_c0_g1_i1:40-1689(+)
MSTLQAIRERYEDRMRSHKNSQPHTFEFEFHGFDFTDVGQILCNFSCGYSLFLEGVEWPSINHYYQAMKFTDNDVQEKIRAAPDPFEASYLGKNRAWGIHMRDNWDTERVEYMHRGLAAKFTQNEAAEKALLSTGNDKIVCYNDTDPFWGSPGENELGKLLEKVRSKISGMHKPLRRPMEEQKADFDEFVDANPEAVVFSFYGEEGWNNSLLSSHAETPFFCGCTLWKTVNHYFQTRKWPNNEPFKKFILSRKTAVEATSSAWRVDEKLDTVTWNAERDGIMEEALFMKFTQHRESRELLLETGKKDIICYSENPHWGKNMQNNGINVLGELLMTVRTQLRQEPLTRVLLREDERAFLVYNLLSRAECVKLVQETEAKGYEALPPGMYGERNNERVIVDDRPLAKTVWERIQRYIPEEYIDDKKTKWKVVECNNRWRYCKYSPGQYFQTHYDGAVHYDGKTSWYTVNLYLNDEGTEFEGGTTTFFETIHSKDPMFAIRPMAGMALVFTQTRHNPHAGEVLTKGKKYITRTDVMYKPILDSRSLASCSVL